MFFDMTYSIRQQYKKYELTRKPEKPKKEEKDFIEMDEIKDSSNQKLENKMKHNRK